MFFSKLVHLGPCDIVVHGWISQDSMSLTPGLELILVEVSRGIA